MVVPGRCSGRPSNGRRTGPGPPAGSRGRSSRSTPPVCGGPEWAVTTRGPARSASLRGRCPSAVLPPTGIGDAPGRARRVLALSHARQTTIAALACMARPHHGHRGQRSRRRPGRAIPAGGHVRGGDGTTTCPPSVGHESHFQRSLRDRSGGSFSGDQSLRLAALRGAVQARPPCRSTSYSKPGVGVADIRTNTGAVRRSGSRRCSDGFARTQPGQVGVVGHGSGAGFSPHSKPGSLFRAAPSCGGPCTRIVACSVPSGNVR